MTLSFLPSSAPSVPSSAPESERRPLPSVFARDVTRGLSAFPKRLSSKYLYDDEGSRLTLYVATVHGDAPDPEVMGTLDAIRRLVEADV